MDGRVLRYRREQAQRQTIAWHWKAGLLSCVPILLYVSYVMWQTGTTPLELVQRAQLLF